MSLAAAAQTSSLFGANGGGLGNLLSGLGGLGGNQPNGTTSGGDAASKPLGGKLGDTLGSLIQQGLGGQGLGGASRPRGVPAPPPSAPAQDDATPTAPQDSQPMNDVLKQLFSRPPN